MLVRSQRSEIGRLGAARCSSTRRTRLYRASVSRLRRSSSLANVAEKRADFAATAPEVWAHSQKASTKPGHSDGARCAPDRFRNGFSTPMSAALAAASP
jgi:hypothetical protein